VPARLSITVDFADSHRGIGGLSMKRKKGRFAQNEGKKGGSKRGRVSSADTPKFCPICSLQRGPSKDTATVLPTTSRGTVFTRNYKLFLEIGNIDEKKLESRIAQGQTEWDKACQPCTRRMNLVEQLVTGIATAMETVRESVDMAIQERKRSGRSTLNAAVQMSTGTYLACIAFMSG
jgi:hypothetical protein